MLQYFHCVLVLCTSAVFILQPHFHPKYCVLIPVSRKTHKIDLKLVALIGLDNQLPIFERALTRRKALPNRLATFLVNFRRQQNHLWKLKQALRRLSNARWTPRNVQPGDKHE